MREIPQQKCFICDKELDQADSYGTPWPATCFESGGNWGSTIIDGGGTIEIWICDVCVTKRIDKVIGYDESFMNKEVREDVMEWYNMKPTEKEVLKKWYYEENKSLKDIAKSCGISIDDVKYKLHKHGLKTKFEIFSEKPRKFSKEWLKKEKYKHDEMDRDQ